MQNLDAYYMTIRLEAEIAARRAEQRAKHAEYTPTRRHAALVRLATALAPIGLLFGLPVH
jgi:hypothetical protein